MPLVNLPTEANGIDPARPVSSELSTPQSPPAFVNNLCNLRRPPLREGRKNRLNIRQ
jgi:hypothetical protein